MRVTATPDRIEFLEAEEVTNKWGNEYSFEVPDELIVAYKTILEGARVLETRITEWSCHCHGAMNSDKLEGCTGVNETCPCDCARCKGRALIPRGDNNLAIWDIYHNNIWIGCVLGTSEANAAFRAVSQHKFPATEIYKITAKRRYT